MSNSKSSEQEIQRFGEKLHLLRIYHKLSLKQLATILGYSTHSYISELETGKKTPTAEFVLKIARLFSVSTDDLLKDEREVSPRE